jgi:glycosyltransferase involved in cell wall biosynthesis
MDTQFRRGRTAGVRLRVVALLATHNEERFVGGCLDHLVAHGIETYLIDNESTDRTVEIAERYVGRGLIGVETFPRTGVYSWRPLLDRKAEVAATLEADWFLHMDADEFRLPPRRGITLAEAIAEVDRLGYNAINFQEFTFVPTRESPDHDHQDFQRTMQWYYPFLSEHPHRLNAWKKQVIPVDLGSSGGHRVDFEGLRMYPDSLPMRHYLFLSVDHAIRKYVVRRYDENEVAMGWHGGRHKLTADAIRLSSEDELREYRSDAELDASDALPRHPLFAPFEDESAAAAAYSGHPPAG